VTRTRGFSAIELMNFVALAAVIAAIAMYGVARYVRHGKTTEALESVKRLATETASFYNQSDATQPSGATPNAVHAMRHFPPSSRTAVPAEADSVRGTKYQSNAMDWAASPWKELKFSIVQPQCYQYSFTATGAGTTARALVVAEGDLDGDGKKSHYSLAVVPDESLTAQVAKEIDRTDPEE
jgi:Tfp pilus assembly protein PilE